MRARETEREIQWALHWGAFLRIRAGRRKINITGDLVQIKRQR